MKILALEFSSERRGVAIGLDGVVRGYAEEESGRKTRAFALIGSALNEAGVARQEIECVAVGIGPGSYAGIRIAIAIAQGWQLASGVRLLGISSADVIAHTAHQEGIRGTLNIVFDAQRNEAYAARYGIDASGVGAAGSLTLLTNAEEEARRRAGELFVKADRGPWRLDEERLLWPDARMLVRLAAGRTDFVPGPRIEPVYLRKAEFVKTRLPSS